MASYAGAQAGDPQPPCHLRGTLQTLACAGAQSGEVPGTTEVASRQGCTSPS